jgi:hypothetical protein
MWLKNILKWEEKEFSVSDLKKVSDVENLRLLGR